ncbi:MAG: gamma-glutamyl-gamma-aminobutyrate hydrolase family protein [Phycisphaerales bacterium]|nr:gamma-glutamyl-gamma-aminobutyrate hydrolase family protein [Phycisphaerales bacterium]
MAPHYSAAHPGATPPADAPVVGLTCSLDDKDARLRRAYIDAVFRAGGVPVLLPPPGPSADTDAAARAVARRCDAVVFTGGDDPATERYGEPTHPKAVRVHPDRQRFEEALLRALDELAAERVDRPTLGICLGMQMMALHHGGRLNQHMPDDTPTHADHHQDRPHAVRLLVPDCPAVREGGTVTSWHRQAVRDPGSMRTVAVAHDGVIEALDRPGRRFYAGVQWHPERTPSAPLGDEVFRRLIAATRGRS